MVQGGDPTGTGKGGESCWGRGFRDEVDGPRSFAEGRGVLAMANKGKGTNGSQFFVVYRAAKHLDRKHTIFGKVVGGMETLDRMEEVAVGAGEAAAAGGAGGGKGGGKGGGVGKGGGTGKAGGVGAGEIRIEEITVLSDPFEAFMKSKKEKEAEELVRKEVQRRGGREDDRTTWTGKRVRGVEGGEMEASMGDASSDAASLGVGKYLHAKEEEGGGKATGGGMREEWDAEEQPVRKKVRGGGGGFGNFEAW